MPAPVSHVEPRLRLHLETRLSGRDVPRSAGSRRDDFDSRTALRAFERAVRVAPTDPDYHFVFGEALLQEGQHAEALEAFQQATRLHPREATYQLALGEALWRLERHEEAAKALRLASDLEPDDADAWSGLGAALVALRLDGPARTALSRTLELAPERIDARNNLGILLWRAGATEQAIDALRAALRRDTRAANVQLNLARMLLASGDARHGEKALQRAHRLAPRDPEPLLDLADLQLASGRRREAAWSYERALAASPSCLDARPDSRAAHTALLHEAIRGELSLARHGRWWTPLELLRSAWRAVERTLPSRAGSRRGLGLALSLAALLAAAHTGRVLGPPYLQRFAFEDDLALVAMAPVDDDEDVRERLDLAIRQNDLDARIREGDCTITTRDRTRRVECRYSVPVTLLPGRTRQLHFALSVERVYLAPEETLFF